MSGIAGASGGPLWAALKRRTADPGEGPALVVVCPEGTLVEEVSWAAIARASEALHHELLAAGVGSGARVALATAAPAAPLVALLACALGGRVLAPLHARWSAAARAAACATLQQRATLSMASDALFGEPGGPRWRLSAGPPGPGGTPTLGSACIALPTSGTTASPGWALLDEQALYAAATAAAETLALTPRDAWIAAMPLYHVGGLSVLTRGLVSGATTIALPGFAPPAIGRLLEGTRAPARVEPSGISLVPTMLHRLLAADAGPGPLRVALIGGAACPPSLVQRAVKAGWPLRLTYGLTEAASQVTTAAPGEAVTAPHLCGRALPGVRVRIAQPDGEGVGEIVVGGPTLFQGYLADPERSATALRGGELWTGDLGRLDPQGRLEVLDRRVDLIVSGGENVLPARVEAVLREVPGVSEVAVVGVADAVWGQRVAAALEIETGSDGAAVLAAARAHARDRLAGHEQPRDWKAVPELPRTGSGKVRRAAVRAGW